MTDEARIKTQLGFKRAKLQRQANILKHKLKRAKGEARVAVQSGDERQFKRAGRRYAQLKTQHDQVLALLASIDGMIDKLEMKTAIADIGTISSELKALQTQAFGKKKEKAHFWQRETEKEGAPEEKLVSDLAGINEVLTNQGEKVSLFGDLLGDAVHSQTEADTADSLRQELMAELEGKDLVEKPPVPKERLEKPISTHVDRDPEQTEEVITAETGIATAVPAEETTAIPSNFTGEAEPEREGGAALAAASFTSVESGTGHVSSRSGSIGIPQFPICKSCNEPILAYFADYHKKCSETMEKQCRCCGKALEGSGYLYYTLNTFMFYYCVECSRTPNCTVCSLPVGAQRSQRDIENEFMLCPGCSERFVHTDSAAANLVREVVIPGLEGLGLEPLTQVPTETTLPGNAGLGGLASIDGEGDQKVQMVMTVRPYFDTICAHEYTHIFCYQNYLKASKLCTHIPCPFHEGFAELFAFRFAKRRGLTQEQFEKMESPDYNMYFHKFLSIYKRHGFEGCIETLLAHEYPEEG